MKIEYSMNSSPIWELGMSRPTTWHRGPARVIASFDFGIIIMKVADNEWLVTEASGEMSFKYLSMFNRKLIGEILTARDILHLCYLYGHHEVKTILQHIQTFGHVDIISFMEEINDPEIEDFIIFNIDLF